MLSRGIHSMEIKEPLLKDEQSRYKYSRRRMERKRRTES